MSLFENIFKKNIDISWSTLWIGWLGFDGFGRLTTPDDISEYACRLIGQEETSQDVIVLSCSADLDRVTFALHRLATQTTYDENVEARKWRLVLFESVLKNLPDEPLAAALEIVGFWGLWKFPNDGPIGDVANISNEMYSKLGFEKLKQDSNDWFEAEIRRLQRE